MLAGIFQTNFHASAAGETFCNDNEAFLGVPVSECQALVDIYNNTNGDGWTNSTNWFTTPVANWYGVNVIDGNVMELNLESNKLNGILPASIGNLSLLTSLTVAYNYITSFPSEIGLLTNLKTLNL